MSCGDLLGGCWRRRKLSSAAQVGLFPTTLPRSERACGAAGLSNAGRQVVALEGSADRAHAVADQMAPALWRVIIFPWRLGISLFVDPLWSKGI